MIYPVELLPTRTDCVPVIADSTADVERAQFRITTLQRSASLRTDDAADDAAEISSLTDQITLQETRVAGMPAGETRTKAELQLRALRRQREELQDAQLVQGARTVFRRQRALDAAQRELAGYQDCLAQVTAHHNSLPA